MTDEWLNETENFGTRRERLLEEIEAVLSRFGGDILDNGPKGSMRYLSDHLGDLVVRWADGAMCHEREQIASMFDRNPNAEMFRQDIADRIRARKDQE